jgi:hypothetical protein
VLYGPISDELLADQADLIVEFDVLAVMPASETDSTFPLFVETELVALAPRVLKGRLDAATFTFRVIGGELGEGRAVVIPGVPELRPGDRGIGFFTVGKDGSLRPLHLGQGLFSREDVEGGALAIPHASPAVFLEEENDAPARARDYELFASWLVDRGRGDRRSGDYWAPAGALEATGHARQAQPFTLMNADGRNARWIDFDEQRSVLWRLNPSQSFGAAAAFQAALGLWNNDGSTNIRYVYAGETAATFFSNGEQSRGEGLVLFDDPADLAPGTVTCAAPDRPSGVLAVGGFALMQADDGSLLSQSERLAGAQPAVRVFQGREVGVIAVAFIMVNDGMECFLRRAKLANQVELFGHELGHTLGIGHACGDTPARCPKAVQNVALMRAIAHLDGKHNRLYLDDINAAKSLYGASGGGGGGGGGGATGALAPPTGLVAQAVGGGEITLAWRDNSTTEQRFLVHIKAGAAAWRVLGAVPADSTGALVSGSTPGVVYRFRVRAERGNQRSLWSNVATVRSVG